ncbi:colicin [Clostridium kluyveri]|uniref:Colicin n=2 Tax=Clostridium kluyveri TaxID=1534 RepID=A0A1L5FE33_CLOKL|nr:colicin [Clostridium kluyveri]
MRGSNGNIGLVPKEVADNLGGREFSNFDEFRKAFWKEYSNSSYASEFSKSNIKRMSQGLAPKAPASQQYGKISSYVLHHKNPIYNGGGVYDLDNIVISSPRMHQEILDKGFHFNK